MPGCQGQHDFKWDCSGCCLTQIPEDKNYNTYTKKQCNWTAYFDRVNWVHVIKTVPNEIIALGCQKQDWLVLPGRANHPLSLAAFYSRLAADYGPVAGLGWFLHSTSRALALWVTGRESFTQLWAVLCLWNIKNLNVWSNNGLKYFKDSSFPGS